MPVVDLESGGGERGVPRVVGRGAPYRGHTSKVRVAFGAHLPGAPGEPVQRGIQDPVARAGTQRAGQPDPELPRADAHISRVRVSNRGARCLDPDQGVSLEIQSWHGQPREYLAWLGLQPDRCRHLDRCEQAGKITGISQPGRAPADLTHRIPRRPRHGLCLP